MHWHCRILFLHHGAIHAAGAGPPQWKMGVVCIRATFLVCFVFRLHWTLINSSRMNDNYEKWTQVVWGCDRHHAQNLVLWYCVTKAPPLAPSMGSIAINRCSCKKSAWASFDSFGAMTFLLRNQKKKKKSQKNWKNAASMDSHIIYHMQNHTSFAATAAKLQTWICSFILNVVFLDFDCIAHDFSHLIKRRNSTLMQVCFELCGQKKFLHKRTTSNIYTHDIHSVCIMSHCPRLNSKERSCLPTQVGWTTKFFWFYTEKQNMFESVYSAESKHSAKFQADISSNFWNIDFLVHWHKCYIFTQNAKFRQGYQKEQLLWTLNKNIFSINIMQSSRK